jgi:integrase
MINKFLRENKLLESDRHTLYGLRHSFEDRCLRAKIDERVRRDLMGHALGRQRYGEGGGLAHVRDLMVPVAF